MADNVNSTTKILAKAITEYLALNGGSHYDIALGSGVSAASVSRIVRLCGAPDMDTIIGLCGFLRLSVGRVLETGEAVVYYPKKSTPEIVREFLEKDETLLPGGAQILSAVFESAYQQTLALGKVPSGENTPVNFQKVNL